ncbi:MAG: SDR family NAD(P)-dependent oxidoreductase [Verrucomicrobiota bacterium]
MQKTILITGATDGIGLETSRRLLALGHNVLLHGRNPSKLTRIARDLSTSKEIESYVADLTDMAEVEALANAVLDKHKKLDVLINNAGVLKSPERLTKDGLDLRFAVNTIAPYLLTKRLWSLFDESGRIINLSSAAQAPVDLSALMGKTSLDNMTAYAQSKLAITMWSRQMASATPGAPVIVAVNPGSLLATKMVKEGFGMSGKDLNIGAEVLVRAALADEFADSSGKYFDNDLGVFSDPHPDALDKDKLAAIVLKIEEILDQLKASQKTR